MIAQVRVIPDMTNEAYQDSTALSRSDALTILRAGTRTAKYRKENRDVSTKSPALEFGSMFHLAMEGISAFEFRYYPEPKGDKRTKEVKAQIEELRTTMPDKELIPEETYLKVIAMAQAAHDHPAVHAMLLGRHVEREVSLFGQSEFGPTIKARPDLVIPDAGIIIDWKSCQDASELGFARSVESYGYYMQTAWYTVLAEAHWGRPFQFVFVNVEKDAPYNVCVAELDPLWVRWAHGQMKDAILQWAHSERTGDWYAYPDHVVTVEAPKRIRETMGVTL